MDGAFFHFSIPKNATHTTNATGEDGFGIPPCSCPGSEL